MEKEMQEKSKAEILEIITQHVEARIEDVFDMADKKHSMPGFESSSSVGPYKLLARASQESPVFHAVDSRTGEKCIVKFGSPKSALLPETADAIRIRLEEESKKLRRWSVCPNVVRLLDAQLDLDPPFLVLESLGINLNDKTPDNEGLSFTECLAVLRDVSAALSGIHKFGDDHGDVKPEGILMHLTTGRWTLTDPGDSDLSTDDYASEHLKGWEADILALGRTFITSYTGSIDSQLDDLMRGALEDEHPSFVRLLDRMLRDRPSIGRGGQSSRPSARRILDLVTNLLRNAG